MLACNFLMIPSMMMSLNVIYPESFYEGTRIFGSFVLPDIPQYESDTQIPKIIFGKNTTYVTSRRLLSDLSVSQVN
mgnify:CR=1 FL=1